MEAPSQFDKFSSAFAVAAAFANRIHGKNVLVTGGNPKGLGAATAEAVASQAPATLIITYRLEATVADLITRLESIAPETNVIGVELDLSDLHSVRAAADRVNTLINRLDILINNAGVMSIQNRELTNYGVEKHFGTNHIGHFLFTNLLLPKLLAAAEKNAPEQTRIVNLTGGWHHFSPIRFHDLNWDGKPIPVDEEPDRAHLAQFRLQSEGDYLPEAAYAQSKTANILFSAYLTEHLKKKGIVSYSVNPGGIMTDIGRNLPQNQVDQIIGSGILDKTPDQGASTTMVAAFDPRIHPEASVYMDNCVQLAAAKHASDLSIAEKLWKLSEKIVGQEFEL